MISPCNNASNDESLLVLPISASSSINTIDSSFPFILPSSLHSATTTTNSSFVFPAATSTFITSSLSSNDAQICLHSSPPLSTTINATTTTSSSFLPSSARPIIPSSSLRGRPSVLDSAKSFVAAFLPSFSFSSPREEEPLTINIGRDKGQKHSNSLSSARIGESPTRMLERTTIHDDGERKQQVNVDWRPWNNINNNKYEGATTITPLSNRFDSPFASTALSNRPSPSPSATITRPFPSSSSRIVTRPSSSLSQHVFDTIGENNIANHPIDAPSFDNYPSASASLAAKLAYTSIATTSSFLPLLPSRPPVQQQSSLLTSSTRGSTGMNVRMEEEEKKGEIDDTPTATIALAPASFNTRLMNMFSHPTTTSTTTTTSSIHATTHSSSTLFSATTKNPSSSPPIDCFCLTIDPHDLLHPLSATDRSLYTAAHAMRIDTERRLLLLQLLPSVNAIEIDATYIAKDQLHINFNSAATMHRAQVNHPFLSRCGSSTRICNNHACGPKRHQLPELIMMSCIPTAVHTQAEIAEEVKKMLTSMNVVYTNINITSTSSPNYRGNMPSSINVSVVPRTINDVREKVTRLHKHHTLFGALVSVTAPNRPDLTRCTRCDGLDHDALSCPEFDGLHLRLLFHQPIPFAEKNKLVAKFDARSGYLSNTTEAGPPHRVVTLVFHVDARIIEAVDALFARLAPLIDEYHDRLYNAPTIIDADRRFSECRDCGSCTREHQCAFASNTASSYIQAASQSASVTTQLPRSSLVAPRQPLRTTTARPVSASSAAAATRALTTCLEWLNHKRCERKDTTRGCGFAHPDVAVLPASPCFNFRDKGSCRFGAACKYSHGDASSSIATIAAAPMTSLSPVPSIITSPIATTPTSLSSHMIIPVHSPLDIAQQHRLSLMNVQSSSPISSVPAHASSIAIPSSISPSASNALPIVTISPSKVPLTIVVPSRSSTALNKRRHVSSPPPVLSIPNDNIIDTSTPVSQPAKKRGRKANEIATVPMLTSTLDETSTSSSSSSSIPIHINPFSGLAMNDDDDSSSNRISSSSSLSLPISTFTIPSPSIAVPMSSLNTISSPRRVHSTASTRVAPTPSKAIKTLSYTRSNSNITPSAPSLSISSSYASSISLLSSASTSITVSSLSSSSSSYSSSSTMISQPSSSSLPSSLITNADQPATTTPSSTSTSSSTAHRTDVRKD